MTREKEILVLFEDCNIREESVRYSIELARRLEMPILLLMLATDALRASCSEDVLVKELLEPIQQARIKVSKDIRYGNKATELLKYLAVHSSLAVIVWGSDERMVGKLGSGKPHHWLNKLTGMLPCSIVSPIPRTKDIKANTCKHTEG
ncbi:MAG: hypothetical protein JXR49_23330 [Acidobacteria bacterium]|nr:hypothetical protein [Acidobacteriota bacterium]